MNSELKAKLASIAPSIAFSASREIDHSFQWDGFGPDPALDGFYPNDVTVRARAIVNGETMVGNAYLGGSYFKDGEPMEDIHGYLPQMLEEAANELVERMSEHGTPPAYSEGMAAIAFLKQYMRESYEAQRMELAD